MFRQLLSMIWHITLPMFAGPYLLSSGIEKLLETKDYYYGCLCLFAGLIIAISFGIWIGLILYSKFNLKFTIEKIQNTKDPE